MLKAIIEVIVIYILFRLVVNFILPLIRNYKRVKKHLQEMQNHLNSQQNQNTNQHQSFQNQTKQKDISNDKGEYIDYEEVE